MANPTTITTTEAAYIAEIIGCAEVDTFEDRFLELTAAQETILKADVELWQSVRDDFDSINSPKSGVKSDPADTRRAIRRRVITMFDAADLANSYSTGTIQLVRA